MTKLNDPDFIFGRKFSKFGRFWLKIRLNPTFYRKTLEISTLDAFICQMNYRNHHLMLHFNIINRARK